MSHYWVSDSEDACDQFGSSPKRRPELHAVLQWLESKKKTDLRTLLREPALNEEGQMVWRNCQKFITF